MIEVPVYIPAPQGAGRDRRMGEHLRDVIAPRSAIVGSGDPDPRLLPEMIVVYYEGNLHGASNMLTFADRAMHAYWRMRDHYPTVAMMAVPLSQVERVGALYPEHGRIELDGELEARRTARWIEVGAAELPRELATSEPVRAA